MNYQLQYKVMGSLTHEMGDGVLAYSTGVSSVADTLCTLFSDMSGQEYASLYLYTNPDTRCYQMVHVQPAHVTFPGHGRAYTTRVVYETPLREWVAAEGGVTPLVAAADKMRFYDHREPDGDAMVVGSSAPVLLTDEERRLLQYIVYGIMHQRQIFIRLGAEEQRRADQLRQSPRLQALLHAIDALPSCARPYASVGYAVNCGNRGTLALFGHLMVIAHLDDISRWGNASTEGMVLDWTGDTLRTVNARRASEAEMARFEQVAPLVPLLMGERQPTRGLFCHLAVSIPQNIDRVLGKKRLDTNDLLILQTVSKGGENTYRHGDVIARLNEVEQEKNKTKEPSTTSKDTHTETPIAGQMDKRWLQRHRKKLMLAVALLVVLVVSMTCFKQCTQVGKPAAADIYVPSAKAGFVKKANDLLAHLVDRGNSDPYAKMRPRTIAELEKRYPGLEFVLPYSESDVEGGRAADIRLVGINPDSIADEADRRFYFNSDIPSLLEKQRSHLGERMFRISFSSGDALAIERIEVVPAMFKVALVKDPWVGTITCADNTLFPASQHCFVSWGKSVLPLRQSKGHLSQGGGYNKVFVADDDTHTLRTVNGREVNFWQLNSAYTADTTTLCIRWPGQEQEIYLEYLDDHQVRIKPVGMYCQPYDDRGPMKSSLPLSSSSAGQVYLLDHDIKLVLSKQKNSEKITELLISRDNPMLRLSSLIHTNAGRSRYTIPPNLTDRFTQQVLRGLSSTLRNTVYTDSIHLSLDPMLSLQMEQELANYCKALKRSGRFYNDDQWELSLTVMDMANGCIVAAPYYRSADQGVDYELAVSRKNPALMRRYVGSAFKPLVALAAVLTRPELAHLNTVGKYSLKQETLREKGRVTTGKAMFFGKETDAWSLSSSTRSFWNGCSGMSQFFAVSDDVYPVALVAKALNYGEQAGSPFVFKNRDVLLQTNSNFSWAGSRFMHYLDKLYTLPGLKDYMANDSLQMAYYTWDQLRLDSIDRFGLDNVSPDPTLLYYDMLNMPGATMKRELVPWILGQGSNEWNSLKLAEAWTRMLTKHKVSASLVTPQGDYHDENLSRDCDNNAWNALLKALLDAQRNSPRLLTPMYNRVAQLNREEHIADTLLLFSKTGTPDNYAREEWKRIGGGPLWLDMGLYCMALMPQSAYKSVLKGGDAHGLMCVVRVTRIVDRKAHPQIAKGGENGINSSDARNFFSDSDVRLRRFYQMTKGYLK